METRSLVGSFGSVSAGALVVLALAGPLAGQVTERVSVHSLGAEGNDHSIYPSVSADGRYVAFHSLATNLVPGDTNGVQDVFVRDRQSGTTERVSVDSLGAQGNSLSEFPSISADGRYVAFHSWASNLVPGDTNGWGDVFVRDCQSGTTERVSVDSLGAEGNYTSGFSRPSISPDGCCVAFESAASNLVTGDTNGEEDVFVRDRRSKDAKVNRFPGPVSSGGTVSVSLVVTPRSGHKFLLSVSDPRGTSGPDLVPLVVLTTWSDLERDSSSARRGTMIGAFTAAPGVQVEIPMPADPSLLPQPLHARGFLLDRKHAGGPLLVPALVIQVE